MLTGLDTLPASLSIASAVAGPEAGIIPSGRNWPLSLASALMYTDLVISPLET